VRAALLAASPEQRAALLETYVHEQVARTLALSPERLDRRQPLANAGFDSLMAIEVRGRLQSELDVVIPIVALLENPSVADLTPKLLDQLTASVVVGPEGDGSEDLML
jgi:acyl carrier protein